MNGHPIQFCGAELTARASGALWWPRRALLIVSDLHLGKAARRARGGALLLPPYETADTLSRLAHELRQTAASTVLCLGDSFDDGAAARSLSPDDQATLEALQQGRDWLWIDGNHDQGAAAPGGMQHHELTLGAITFRHIAAKALPENQGEISGHYHPKASLSLRGAALSRPCFLVDARRMILPAFGTYTGGLTWQSEVFKSLMSPDALAILTGPTALALPLSRASQRRASASRA